jgi:hypothetical protein
MAGKYMPVLALMVCAYGFLSSVSISMAQGQGPKGPPRRGGMTAPDDADQRTAVLRAIGEAIQKKYHLTARGVGMQSDCKPLPKTTREVAYDIQYVVPYKYVPQNSPLRNGKKWEAIHVSLRRGKDDKWTVAKWEPLPNAR